MIKLHHDDEPRELTLQYRSIEIERKYRIAETETVLSHLRDNARRYLVFGQLLSVVAVETKLSRERVREIANRWPSLWSPANLWN